MKYRTKLFLSFMAVSLINTIIALWIVYRESDRLLFNDIRSKVKSVAATAAVGINSEALLKLQEDPTHNPEIYEAIRIYLRKVRDANRRPDIHAHFVYTLFRSKTNPSELLYGVDSSEDPRDFSAYGTPFHDDDDILPHLDYPYSPDRLTNDRWGKWLSGFAPIVAANEDVIAYLGIDVKAARVQIVLNELIGFAIAALTFSILIAIFFGYILSKIVTRSLHIICDSIEEIGKGNLTFRTHLDTHDEFDDLSTAINSMAKGLQERERLKLGFARYVSQYILEKILKSGSSAKFEGERKKITVIFTDIRHFTAIAEKLPPEDVVKILNQYFEEMIEVIFRNHGTLDKFLGDGIMIEFGAPLDDELQEKHAVITAIEMQQALKKLNAKWTEEGKEALKIGVGIHTGLAVVGNIGSERRMEYTAIGDTVNVASRLEQATKFADVSILISKATFTPIEGIFKALPMGALEVPGRHEPIDAFSIDPDQEIRPLT